MMLANNEAQKFGDEYIDSQHILIGLIKEGAGVAAEVFKNLNVDLVRITMEVEDLVQSKPERTVGDGLPKTPRAKQIIEYAIEECRLLKHQYVGTEHLLLGLLREGEGVAAQVLQNLGLERQAIRDEVLAILGHVTGGATPDQANANSSDLSEPTKIVLQMLPLVPHHELQVVMKKILDLK